ncbi:MAG: hypothetical protein II696_01120 [Firmicutes bacterium]|nr:hypothetical protein [Bacillota bacterium]
MKKRSRFLIVLLSLVFTLASVQVAFAADLFVNHYPKVISAGKMVSGKLKGFSDQKCYSFFSGGGTYKVEIYVKDPYIDESGVIDTYMTVEYGKYRFNSVNKGWQMPEYHIQGTSSKFVDEWTEDTDGWYKQTVTIGKIKAGRKIGLAVSGDHEGYFKFKLIGKKFAVPKKPVIRSAKGKKRAMIVKWKKAANAKGYLIQISSSKGYGKNYKEIRVKGTKRAKTIRNLKKGRYYVKMCSYKKVRGVTAYSSWSKAKKVVVR